MTKFKNNVNYLNNNCKVLSDFHKSVTKLISDILEDQGEGGVMMKHPIIWYLWKKKALNVLCTGDPDFGMYSVREIHKNVLI